MAKSKRLHTILKAILPAISANAKKYLYPLAQILTASIEPPLLEMIKQLGLTQETLKSELTEILHEDTHLLKCCGTSENFSSAIDLLFSNSIRGLEAKDIDFELVYNFLETSLFGQGDFRKFACFHLYNLDVSPGNHLAEGLFAPWFIKDLPADHISALIGEQTLQSFLSPPTTGKLFLVVEDKEGLNKETLQNWLLRRFKDSSPLRQILQYSKDSIIDFDYCVPYFQPNWVNAIHRRGVYYWGDPRQDAQPNRFLLTEDDCRRIMQMTATYRRYKTQIDDFGCDLRNAIGLAGNHFESYHKKPLRQEQFANLIIALEALYTPDDKQELTNRICLTSSVMVGTTSSDRHEIMEFLKDMFARRGKLFHGKYRVSPNAPEEFVTNDEVAKLSSIVRKSILKFLCLYLEGEIHLNRVQSDLAKALLDQEFGDHLRDKANFDAFMARNTGNA